MSERTTGATKLKIGDEVYTGPYKIVQFRDTYNPGPQDTGDTVILARGDHGAMGADTCLVIPASDVLTSDQRAAIGRMRDYAKYEMHYTHAEEPASQLDEDMAVIDAIADGGAK
jgi:hypothetical protein